MRGALGQRISGDQAKLRSLGIGELRGTAVVCWDSVHASRRDCHGILPTKCVVEFSGRFERGFVMGHDWADLRSVCILLLRAARIERDAGRIACWLGQFVVGVAGAAFSKVCFA